ncbi:MAG: hypothetical protein INQ03_07260 [Candidatus Heimdallarchaeota archaeon]|nr:hypothetical protein [Candidatus Heimdallarchaeota archaeon]
MVKIFILDTAISQVPVDWLKFPMVKQYFDKYQRLPLINASEHQFALKRIPREERKDRPDILHFGLLTALGYSNLIDNLEIYFNLNKGLYEISNTTRIPRDQKRFYGLIESILAGSYRGDLIQSVTLEEDFYQRKKFLLTRHGDNITNYSLEENDILVFGGFAFGKFTHNIGENVIPVSISDNSLELWTAISYVLNCFLQN